MKKLLAILLVVCMLVPMLVACDKKGDDKKGSKGDVEVNTIVPDDVDFGGEEFTILCREDNAWGNYLHEIAADEDATELVNQAIYERNNDTEERLGISLNVYAIPGQWAAKDDFVNTFKNSVLADSKAFDLILGQQAYMADIGLTDLYCNMYEVPYVKDNLKADYYFQDAVKELTINNKLKFVLSDYNLTFWEYLYVTFFNKQIAKDYNLDDIYALVKDGKWTIDKQIEMSKGIYKDLNGDNWPGVEDQYGYSTDYSNTIDCFFSQFDIQPSSHNDEGIPEITIDQGKVVNVLDKMVNFFKTDDTYTYQSYSDQTMDEVPLDDIFTENRALFYPATLAKAQEFRSMETDFGIVPMPKWNDKQEGYYTQAQNGYSVIVVPIDAKNIEMSGAAIDVMSALSSENVIPAYYDQALKDKYARDDQSGEMLDLIREGFKINLGYFYVDINISRAFRIMVPEGNTNFASFYAANKKGYERYLGKIIKSYNDEDDK